MRLHWRTTLVLLGVTVCSAAAAAQCAGVTMPERVQTDGATLRLNGLGLREATVFNIDVYVAALYLPDRDALVIGRDAGRILAATTPRQLRLTLLRDVSVADMRSNIQAGFQRAAGPAADRYRGPLSQLIAWLPPLSAGDCFTLDYRPDRGLQVRHQDTVLGTLPGADFASLLFAIWLGDRPLSPALKAGLMGAPCRN